MINTAVKTGWNNYQTTTLEKGTSSAEGTLLEEGTRKCRESPYLKRKLHSATIQRIPASNVNLCFCHIEEPVVICPTSRYLNISSTKMLKCLDVVDMTTSFRNATQSAEGTT